MPVATITSVSSLFKVIPGVGSFVGSSGVSISSGGLTYTVGKILTQHFEQGGTFENFNVIEAKNQFKNEFSHNVKIVGKMKLNSPLKQGG